MVAVEEERILLLDQVQKQCDKADEEDDVNDEAHEDVGIGSKRNIDDRCLARLHIEKLYVIEVELHSFFFCKQMNVFQRQFGGIKQSLFRWVMTDGENKWIE